MTFFIFFPFFFLVCAYLCINICHLELFYIFLSYLSLSLSLSKKEKEKRKKKMSNLSTVEAKLPPGFRFHPRDEELICDYLMKKVSSSQLPLPLLIEVDLNKCEPWDIPGTFLFLFLSLTSFCWKLMHCVSLLKIKNLLKLQTLHKINVFFGHK